MLLLATTFQSHNPLGWYQVQLPVNGLINDIFFVDSQKGWIAVGGANDSAFILNSTDGGDSWISQFKASPFRINVVEFVDENTGFAGGRSIQNGKYMIKTTNGGLNWFQVFQELGNEVSDVDFADANHGWHCDNFNFDGGVFRTTDGGSTWQRLLEPGPYAKLFFLNRDTGWVSTFESSGKLFRTINGGLNWELQFTSISTIESVFFLDGKKGWIRGTPNGSPGYVISYTTNSGVNWINSTGNTGGGFDIEFINDTLGITGLTTNRIPTSTDGGRNWGYQISPINSNLSTATIRGDVQHAWTGRFSLAKTETGMDPIVISGINSPSTETPSGIVLNQNYPNPFNPITKITFELKNKVYAELTVFDIRGVKVKTLINKLISAGTHVVEFNASDLPSGVYIYCLYVDGKKMGVRRMTLLK